MSKRFTISLSISLPGGVMYSSQTCEENVTITKDENNKVTKVYRDPKYWDNHQETIIVKENGKDVEKNVFVYTRKSIPAVQRMSLNEDAFDYFIDSKSGGSIGFSKKEWLKMSPMQRISAHCSTICKDLGGISYTFDVRESD